MGQLVQMPDGMQVYVHDDGTVSQAERPGLLAQAGRNVANITSGLQMATGYALDDQELIRSAREDVAERNRLFAGADEAYPWESMIGQGLPSVATFPIAGVLPSMAIGATESALDISQPGSVQQRIAAGAMGGLFGEAAGRIVGRIMNGVEGISRAITGEVLEANPDAKAFEALGGELMAYQRMTPDTLGQGLAMRVAQGADAALIPTSKISGRAARNEALLNRTVADAVGVPPDAAGRLSPEWRGEVVQRFNDEFGYIEASARQAGELDISESVANRLARNPEIKNANTEDGLFQAIMDGGTVLEPGEYIEARDAMTDHINSLYSKGANKRAIRAERALKALDDEIAAKVGGEEFGAEFAKLREQYRVFKLLERPNVINKKGGLNPGAANRVLRSESGFGRAATAGQEVTNPETRALIDLAEAADKPDFAPFQTSATAERQALREGADDVGEAATGGMAGIIRAGINQGAPFVAPLMEAGGGLPYERMMNQPAPRSWVELGRAAGRGMLDEAFYPFVGIDDERPR